MSEALSTRCAVQLLLLEPFFLPVSNLPTHLPQFPFQSSHPPLNVCIFVSVDFSSLSFVLLPVSINWFCKAFVQQVLVCFTTKINAPRHCAPIPLTTDRIGFIPFLCGTSFYYVLLTNAPRAEWEMTQRVYLKCLHETSSVVTRPKSCS